ncbi:thioredoxin domain-containing protein [Motiliproteus sp. SC1-56]|uniref:thioredoxin domain-containing protein n=1 Tax=Motiliproteus sp. SC1-56 TaxID=2799565 RepID=UPI001A90B69D|nr:thioredoxin domain-containing protein [Motiliproteus sp. SC1-56]
MKRFFGRLALTTGLISASLLASAQPTLHYDGKTYRADELPGALRQSFYELELQQHEQRQQAADQYIFNRYLQEEAEKQGVSVRELQEELLAPEEPTEAELRALYDANQSRIQGSFEQVRDNMATYLKNQRIQQQQQQLLEQVRKEKDYRFQQAPPTPPQFEITLEGYPSQGPADAPVTLVEFADYQCPHCKQAKPVVSEIVKHYGDRIRFVFKDFPLQPGGISQTLAEAAVCAEQQDRYWDFNALLFERQQFLKSVSADMLAEELGLDMKAFDACLTENPGQARVAASAAEARSLGISGTPAFFVNGRPLPHEHGPLQTRLIEAIEAALPASN